MAKFDMLNLNGVNGTSAKRFYVEKLREDLHF
jgi:hypothetical protein